MGGLVPLKRRSAAASLKFESRVSEAVQVTGRGCSGIAAATSRLPALHSGCALRSILATYCSQPWKRSIVRRMMEITKAGLTKRRVPALIAYLNPFRIVEESDASEPWSATIEQVNRQSWD